MEHQFLHLIIVPLILQPKCELTPNEHSIYIRFLFTQQNDTQPNAVMLSEWCYAECYLCCQLCWVSQTSPLCWVSLCWLSLGWVSWRPPVYRQNPKCKIGAVTLVITTLAVIALIVTFRVNDTRHNKTALCIIILSVFRACVAFSIIMLWSTMIHSVLLCYVC